MHQSTLMTVFGSKFELLGAFVVFWMFLAVVTFYRVRTCVQPAAQRINQQKSVNKSSTFLSFQSLPIRVNFWGDQQSPRSQLSVFRKL